MGIVISYDVTTALLPSLMKNWLRKGQMVIVNLAYVEYVDEKHDMLHVSRYDHTTIVPVLTDTSDPSRALATSLSLPSTGIVTKTTRTSLASGSSGGSAPLGGTAIGRGRFVVPTGRSSLGGMSSISSSSSSSSSFSDMSSNRRMSLGNMNSKDISGLSTTITTASTTPISTATKYLIESERRRNEALRNCMEQYQPILLSNIATNTDAIASADLWESCARSRINGATVTLHLSTTSTSDGDSHPSLSYSSTSTSSTAVSASPANDISAGQGLTLRSSGRKSSSSKRTNDRNNKDATTTTTTDTTTGSEKRQRTTEPIHNDDRGGITVLSTVLLDVTYGTITMTFEVCSSKVPLVLLQQPKPSSNCLQSESPVTVICDLVYAQIWEPVGTQHCASNGNDRGKSEGTVGASDGDIEPCNKTTTPLRFASNGGQGRWRIIWMREST